MTKMQEQFNTVHAAIMAQGEQSTQNGSCRFRDADGNKCAIGVLIPDDRYVPRWEFASLPKIRTELTDILTEDFEFYVDLQKAHDEWTGYNFPAYFQARMAAVAKKWGLTLPDTQKPL